ncbi:hypothetical protein OG592_27310 [Streptomyces avidinii]|uniref:hypothetical protein n=1 Tax=Streptomyces avidinii TaxID=1895 RepID=UPI00386C022F|nr:hypothetical protein OG592_27310 [Streptomyces avidinii]
MDADTRLAEIRSREKAATPGPWEAYSKYGEDFYAYLGGCHLEGVGTLIFGNGEAAEADRDFVLEARTDVPWLVAELDEARTKLEIAERRVAELATRLVGRDKQIAELRHGTDRDFDERAVPA